MTQVMHKIILCDGLTNIDFYHLQTSFDMLPKKKNLSISNPEFYIVTWVENKIFKTTLKKNIK